MIYPSLKSNSKPVFRLSMLSLMLIQVQYAVANQDNLQTAVMPTIKIEAMSELDPIKSYIDYDQANVTRNGLKKKDIPQTIDTIDVQKYKIYGANDLSVMLQGTPGVSTNYDTRGDGISLRGFKRTRVISIVMASEKVVNYAVALQMLSELKY